MFLGALPKAFRIFLRRIYLAINKKENRAGAPTMKRKTLVIISLFLSVAGIIALFFLKPEVSPQSMQMKGTVKHVYQKEKVAFITFIPDNMTVVSFDKVNLKPGKHVLNGRLQQYKGKVEFIVDSYD